MNGAGKVVLGGLLAAMAFGVAIAPAEEKVRPAPQRALSRPDGKAPDQTKKVKVFILMGQSNMVGMGDISGGSTPWRSVLQNLVLSVYDGAYSPGIDYDKMTPASTVALTNISQVTAASNPSGKGTCVLRGQVQLATSAMCEFSPGYHCPNIMIIDGTEVYREEAGKPAVKRPFKFEAGKSYPFNVTYLGKPNESGWYTRLDVPGTLHSLVK